MLGVVHPIDLAREVLEDGRHALLVGEWMMRTVLAYRAAQCFRPSPHETDSFPGALAVLWSDAASLCPGYTGGVVGVGPRGPPAWIRSTPHMPVAWRHGARGGHHI